MGKGKANVNLSLAGFEDIFNIGNNSECIVQMPISELYPPEFHPFQVNDDNAMHRLAENIKKYGVREPGLARPKADYGYELLCGNRRKRACELAGLTTMPVIIREMSDDIAAIAMVDSNLEQREKLLFSEKAWAYRVKMEALNHNGIKAEKNSVDILTEQTGDKKNQIFRLIRLTELVPVLLDKVDTKSLAFNAGVVLSYLSRQEQIAVADAMEKYVIKPSVSQAVQLKKMKEAETLTLEDIDKILSDEKKTPQVISKEISKYKSYFPADYTQKQINDVIIKLLTEWKSGVAM